MKESALSSELEKAFSKGGNYTKLPRNDPTRTSLQVVLYRLIDEVSTCAANGDAECFEFLVNFSVRMSLVIRQLTTSNFEIAQKIARQTSFWPILLASNANMFHDNKSLAKRLELGAEATTPVDIERAFRERTLARQISVLLLLFTDSLRRVFQVESLTVSTGKLFENATRLVATPPHFVHAIKLRLHDFEQMKAEEVNGVNEILRDLSEVIGVPYDLHEILEKFSVKANSLPPLSRTTTKTWVAFGKDIIMVLTDHKPEKNPILYEIGKYRRDAHYRKDTTTATFSARKKTANASEDSNVRDGIFTRIKAAYAAVANDGRNSAAD